MVSYSISLYFILEVESLKNQKGASSHASVRYLFGMWRSTGRQKVTQKMQYLCGF